MKFGCIIVLIWLVALLVCLLMIPNYLLWSVVRFPASALLPKSYAGNSNETVYWINAATGGSLEKISFGLIAICLKILPVIILIIFSFLLISSIHQARRLRQRLRRRCSSTNSSVNFNRELRTTTMLVFITLCTALVELPQGLLLVAIGINKQFFTIYSQLGDFWDITSISSSFITFVMYCLMSQQFRLEMLKLICPCTCLTRFDLPDNAHPLPARVNQHKVKSAQAALLLDTTPSAPDDL
jgi:thyrotropin-releasing hormone receptor